MSEQRVRNILVKKISYVIYNRGDFGEIETENKCKLFTKDDTATVLINETARVYGEIIEDLLKFHSCMFGFFNSDIGAKMAVIPRSRDNRAGSPSRCLNLLISRKIPSIFLRLPPATARSARPTRSLLKRRVK
jgi:hypothetical protein